MFEGPDSTLTNTSMAQPAILTHSAMVFAVLKEIIRKRYGVNIEEKASVFLGHSVGEFTALYAAGVVSLTDIVRLVVRIIERTK